MSKKLKTDLTAEQSDYAIYLPALSSFFITAIGKQQSDPVYIPADRHPPGIPTPENLNFFNKKEGIFQYKWGLYSAGHAQLDLTKEVPKEDLVRKRTSDTFLVADSGGFQIAKGVWEGDWTDPTCKKAERYRSRALKWLCGISEYSMTLDIPTWTYTNQYSADRTNIRSYDDAVKATKYNHHYFMKNATGDTKFLNVLQGLDHKSADHWYNEMKDFSDPTKYDNYFKGWAFGGLNMADPHLALKRVVTLIDDGLLEEGKHDWIHVLGTSKMEWAVLLTAIQRAVRRTHNKNLTISYDSASPFLAIANGKIYHEINTPDYRNLHKENKSGKWAYRMEATLDSKKYSMDTRPFGPAGVADGYYDIFEESPISERLLVNDICVYGPNDLNKIGKQGKTSWDTYSYTLMMAHNVWHHINCAQGANRKYDSGHIPLMLVDPLSGVTIGDAIDDVFAAKGLKARLAKIDSYSKLWMGVCGTRGMGGKKAINAGTQFNSMFDMDQVGSDIEAEKAAAPKVASTNLFDFGD